MYVNGQYRGDGPIGRLMHDFDCSNANDMYCEMMAEATRYYKETPKGIEEMCQIFEEIREEGKLEGQNSIVMLINKLQELGRGEEVFLAASDEAYRERLMEELAII